MVKFSILIVTVASFVGCAPPVNLPGVHEPLDAQAWQQCAGELAAREASSMIDDFMLDSKTMLCQGVTLAAEGEVDEGLKVLAEASIRDKQDHRPHYLAGRILAENGRFEEALTQFERSAERFPSMEVPAERLGRKVKEKDGLEAALIFLTKADERKVCPYGCLGLMAKFQHEDGDNEKARATYQRMIESDPGEPAAYVGMAGLDNSSGNFEDEAAGLERARSSTQFSKLGTVARSQILFSLAFARYNAKQYDDASKVIEQAIDLDGKKANWYVLAGWIALKREHTGRALTRFEKAVELNSNLAAAHQGKADALLALDRKEDARTAYQKAKQLNPSDTVTLLKLAYVNALLGDLEKADEQLKEASKLDENHLPQELVTKIIELLKAADKTDQ